VPLTGLAHQILVLGATGPTGREIVGQALEQGHGVTALARHPERLAVKHPRLELVTIDAAADPEAIARVVPGHDVVVSALGRSQGLRSGGLMARATPGIVVAMERAGVRRLVFISAFGVGGTAPEAPWIFRLMFRTMLASIYADKAVAETLIRRSALDWTILAPVLLTNLPGTGRYRLSETPPPHGPWRIARADVATAVLGGINAAETVRKRLVVA
jgi:putative NADH-flavin reductase